MTKDYPYPIAAFDNISNLVGPNLDRIESAFNTAQSIAGGSANCIIPVYNGYLLNYVYYNKYNESDSLTNPLSNYLYDTPLSGVNKIPTSIIKPILVDKELVYKTDGNIIYEKSGVPYLTLSQGESYSQVLSFFNTPSLTLDTLKNLWKNESLYGRLPYGDLVTFLYPNYNYMAVTMGPVIPNTSRILRLDDLTSYNVIYTFGKELPSDDNLYQGKRGSYGGNANNSTLFTVGTSPDSIVYLSGVANASDDWPGTTWKIYDLSINNIN
jgi:hypothetical protein